MIAFVTDRNKSDNVEDSDSPCLVECLNRLTQVIRCSNNKDTLKNSIINKNKLHITCHTDKVALKNHLVLNGLQ